MRGGRNFNGLVSPQIGFGRGVYEVIFGGKSLSKAAGFDRMVSVIRADRETFGRGLCGVRRRSHNLVLQRH